MSSAVHKVPTGVLHPVPAAAEAGGGTRIALIVPTYRRPFDLERCLRAVARQERLPDQLIVVRRADDELSEAVLAGPAIEGLEPRVVVVGVPGVVAALNAGLAIADADIIAFTDDDAAPRPPWLKQLAAAFAEDPRLGGVGGRDWVHQNGRIEQDSRATVGLITWCGRCIGNHHLGVGPAREVDLLKGVNMSFRAAAIAGVRFDTRLLGTGAQVSNEVGVALAVKRAGWTLRYDPGIAVDHYPSVRHDEDKRNLFSGEATYNMAFNETLLLCEHLTGPRRYLYMAWALAIGERATPGLLQWARLTVTGAPHAGTRFARTWSGRLAAWRAAA